MTKTEKAIYELLPYGLPNKNIAGLLSLSTQTVKNNIFVMCHVKGARNRSHLTAMATRELVEWERRHEPVIWID